VLEAGDANRRAGHRGLSPAGVKDTRHLDRLGDLAAAQLPWNNLRPAAYRETIMRYVLRQSITLSAAYTIKAMPLDWQ